MSIEKLLEENTAALIRVAEALESAGSAAAGGKTGGEDAGTKGGAAKGGAKGGTKGGTKANKDAGPTREQVNAAAVKVRDVLGTPAAKKLIKKHGATELAGLEEENFADFIKEAEELLAEADGGEDGDGDGL